MLQVDGLEKRFGRVRAVAGVSFALDKGEVLGFLGPNGAGKTTTMRMIAGYLEPDAGAARVCGVDVAEDRLGAQRHLGYLPEGAPSYPDMTGLAFLRFMAGVRGLTGAQAARAADRAAEMVDLGANGRRPIETLSKGYKRRVGLAAALLHDPPVLILDEPTDGLDPNQKHAVRQLIRAIRDEKAIIISTHLLEEVDAVCTRAAIIAGGALLVDETPAELAARHPLGRLDDVFRNLTEGPRRAEEEPA
ncbi:MAG: ABC transporter ATP-binding protein [Caulobacterales bacterium]|nr:ABC transporter ATP-binding protein [Caulobacterales bacterium]